MAEIAYADEDLITAMDLNVLEVVISAMNRRPESMAVQVEEACSAFYELTVDNPNFRTRAGEVGAVEAVVAAMTRHAGNVKLQEKPCNALAEMTCHDAANQSRAMDVDAFQVIVAAMGGHVVGSAAVQAAACSSLCCVGLDNPEIRVRAGDVGAVEAVVETMTRHAGNDTIIAGSGSLQVEASSALGHLT